MPSITKRQFLYGSSALALAAAAGGQAWAHTAGEPAMSDQPVTSPLLLRKADNLSQGDVLQWLRALRGHPYVKASGFDVTSVFKVKTDAGMYYVGGVNVENRELTTGTCGEEGAIAAAVGAFGQKIDIVEGWVMGAPSGMDTSDIACYPCGECRQRIAQYTAPDAPIHIMGLNGKHLDTQTRGELLPNAFSFRDLEHNASGADVPELAPIAHVAQRLYRQPDAPLKNEDIFAWLSGLRGDVRVSNYNEMTVWRLDNGAYVAGVKVENAAYPSSTNVMAAAAAVMNAHFGLQKVEEIWAFGFHNEASEQQKIHSHHYVPSGASLQILHQFAANTGVKLHAFNGEGMHKTTALASLLPAAPQF